MPVGEHNFFLPPGRKTLTCTEDQAAAIVADWMARGWRCTMEGHSDDGHVTLTFERSAPLTLKKGTR